MKIRPAGAELIDVGKRTDGRTDRHDKAVAVRNFANASKNLIFMHSHIFPYGSDYPELYNIIFHPLKLRNTWHCNYNR